MTIKILIGDCRQRLRELPNGLAHCCVTSPPYFGLRSYLPDHHPDKRLEIGSEETPEEFIAELVDVFREVRRVLRDDGTLWLNMGDSYAGSGRGGYSAAWSSTLDGSKETQAQTPRKTRRGDNIGGTARAAAVTQRGSRLPAGLHESARQSGQIGRLWVPAPSGLKQKDLMGIPWMLAFALRADGWFLRQDIIWSKPNPMPESVTDRCTKAHEYVFLLSKSQRYYFDQESIKEEAARVYAGSEFHTGKTAEHQLGRSSTKPRSAGNKTHKYVSAYGESASEEHRTNAGLMDIAGIAYETRNKRSVWTISSEAFSDAHFATFPPALVEPCILAGSPKGGMILDPFFGAGTTGMVADRLGRDCIGIELNEANAPMVERRLTKDAGMFSQVLVDAGERTAE